VVTTFTNNLTVKTQNFDQSAFVVFVWFSVLTEIFPPYYINPCIEVMETQCVFYEVWNQILNIYTHLLLWNVDSYFFDLFHPHFLSLRSFTLHIHFYPTFGLLLSFTFHFLPLLHVFHIFNEIFQSNRRLLNLSSDNECFRHAVGFFDEYLLVAHSFPLQSAKFITFSLTKHFLFPP
jgi:hypothetical protein